MEWAARRLTLVELAGLQGCHLGPCYLCTSVTPPHFCICWEPLSVVPLPALCLVQLFPPFASHHVSLLFCSHLSVEASHSPFVLPGSRTGSAVYSLTGWPVQLLGDNQIALVCPRSEWKHSFCPLCSFSFS